MSGSKRKPADPRAAARPTHRAVIRDRPDAPARTIDLTLIDGDARTASGELIARLTDGAWYWLDGVPPASWRIVGVGGRPARDGAAALHTITIRFPAVGRRRPVRIGVRLTEAELAAWQRAAGALSIQDWVRSLPGIWRRTGAAEVREIAGAAALISVARR